MRRDKTLARILFIFSIANVILAAPTLVRQTRFVTDRSGEEPTDGSTPLLAPNSGAPESSAGSSWASQVPPPSQAESLDQDSTSLSVAPQSNDPQRASGKSESHYVPPPYAPPPTSGNPSSQNDPPLGSEAQPLLDHTPPASEAAQLHSNPSPGTGAQPFFKDSHPSWHDFRPGTTTEIEEVAEPNFHNGPDVPNFHDYEDHDYYFGFDDPNHDIYKDEVKPKRLCGIIHCWDWDFSQVFADWDWYRWKPPRSYE